MVSLQSPNLETNNPLPSTVPTKCIGFSEFLITGSSTFVRRVGTIPWRPVSATAEENYRRTTTPLFTRSDWWTLSLVRFYQFPGEALHWSLVISPTDDPGPIPVPYVSSIENQVLRNTFILEVRGDPEQMFYKEMKTRKHVSLLEDIHSIYELSSFGVMDLARKEGGTFDAIRNISREIECPKAKNRKLASENCQGWCVKVIERLVEKGVVGQEKLQMAKNMLQSVDLVW